MWGGALPGRIRGKALCAVSLERSFCRHSIRWQRQHVETTAACETTLTSELLRRQLCFRGRRPRTSLALQKSFSAPNAEPFESVMRPRKRPIGLRTPIRRVGKERLPMRIEKSNAGCFGALSVPFLVRPPSLT